MNIPNNEGMACDAVIRHPEKWTGETRAEISHPESDGVGPPVELRLQLLRLKLLSGMAEHIFLV